MSSDFPHPKKRYYLVELDRDGVPVNFIPQPGVNARDTAIKDAQYIIEDDPTGPRYGLAIVEVLEVITPVVTVTSHVEPPIQPDAPEVWDPIAKEEEPQDA